MAVHVVHFSDMFIDPIKEGKKFSTIRKPRRRMINIGDDLLFYTANPNTKNEYIGRSECVSVQPILIYEDILMLDNEPFTTQFMDVNGENHILNKFARTEGFGRWEDLIIWFKKNEKLPYSGMRIIWELTDKKLIF